MKKNLFKILFLFIIYFCLSNGVLAIDCTYLVKGVYQNGKFYENKAEDQQFFAADIIYFNDSIISYDERNVNKYGLDEYDNSFPTEYVVNSCPKYISVFAYGNNETESTQTQWYFPESEDDVETEIKTYAENFKIKYGYQVRAAYLFEDREQSDDAYICKYDDFTLYIKKGSEPKDGKLFPLSSKDKMVTNGGAIGETLQEYRADMNFDNLFIEWYFTEVPLKSCVNFKMHVCGVKKSGDKLIESTIYTDEYASYLKKEKDAQCKDETSEKNDENVVGSDCWAYERNVVQINKLKDEINSDDCDAQCKTSNNIKINSIVTELKETCRILTSNLNYEQSCVKMCLNIKNDLLPLDINSGECGFSQKFINFVLNILKWIKYLVPALIIILSILDFIKAIGADKDEEMKKAQQKFMKRLVIAVLIFIIPFILEFVLDKMGFVAEGCGIIEF